MNTFTIFIIALELWGILLCAISCIGIVLSNSNSRTSRRLKIMMQFCCILLLISDIASYMFYNQQGRLAYYVIRLSIFLIFCINFMYMSLFTRFIWHTLDIKTPCKPKRLYFIYIMSLVSILFLFVSQFTDMLYDIDSHNIYYRGPLYILYPLITCITIGINISFLIEYRKHIDRPILCAIALCFIFPLITATSIAIIYGVSLQNIAIVMATQIMFALDMIDVSMKLKKTEKAFAKARFEAEHDPLTGFFNKTCGMKKMKSYIETMQSDDKVSLLFVDIDDFKNINDSYGHSAGDYWITEIANLLHALCTSDDILCRFGGDEYTLLLTNLFSPVLLQQKFQTFSQCLQEKADAKGQDIHCSIGICIINGSGHSFEKTIELADVALYDAKSKGKNTFSIQFLGNSF